MADAGVKTDAREKLFQEYKRLRTQFPDAPPDEVLDIAERARSSGAPFAEVLEVAKRRFAPASEMVHGGPEMSQGKAALTGFAQGASLGFVDELAGLIGGEGTKEAARDAQRQASDEFPKTTVGAQVAGGITSSLLPGARALQAAKGAKAATAVGAATGALTGAGESEADLSEGEFGQFGKDVALGAALGAGGGAMGASIPAAGKAASRALKRVGRSRLFKAAVGQNKRAFTQMNGKQLFEKAGQYLDDLGIGVGDTTESIGKKLSRRRETIGQALGDMADALDESGARVSTQRVADRIEEQVANPLKRLAANQKEYKRVMNAVEQIRELGDDMPLSEAVEQRRAVQQQINYSKVQGLKAKEEAERKIASIWNDVVDEAAEPLLEKAGKRGRAFQELRHEYGLVQELLGHVENRIAGNQANRVISASDYGAGIGGGAIAATMGGNPLLGIGAAAANYLGRNYGNATAGRAAVRLAKIAAKAEGRGAGKGLRYLLPAASRAATMGAVGDDSPDDESKDPTSFVGQPGAF